MGNKRNVRKLESHLHFFGKHLRNSPPPQPSVETEDPFMQIDSEGPMTESFCESILLDFRCLSKLFCSWLA